MASDEGGLEADRWASSGKVAWLVVDRVTSGTSQGPNRVTNPLMGLGRRPVANMGETKGPWVAWQVDDTLDVA